jgi:hypothetical protein
MQMVVIGRMKVIRDGRSRMTFMAGEILSSRR